MAWDGLIKNRGGKKKQTNNENQIRNLYAATKCNILGFSDFKQY